MPHADGNPIVRLAADPDDRAAWGAAVEAYGDLCWRIALRMLGDRHAAADAVQDSLLALRAGAQRFRTGADADAAAVAWVARVAVNTCHGHRRRRSHDPLPADLTAPAPAARDDLPALLRQALDDLPASQGEAIALRYLAGLDYEGVALALRIAPGAARVRVHRGLATLQRLLSGRGVALSATALTSALDATAAQAVPPLPASVLHAWTEAFLPTLATTSSITIGAIAMGIIAASLTIVLTIASLVGPTMVAPVAAEAAPPAEPAVAPAAPTFVSPNGLAWLVERQLPDGSWPVDVGKPNGTPPAQRVDVTARAILCLLGAGYDHMTPNKHREPVRAGLRWLEGQPEVEHDIIAMALRTMALAEAYAMTTDAKLLVPARAAFDRLLREQRGGGWPARILGHALGGAGAATGPLVLDTRATAYSTMAIKSIEAGGAADTKAPMTAVKTWWKTAATAGGAKGFPVETSIDAAPIGLGTADAAAGVCAVFAGFSSSEPLFMPLIDRMVGALDPDSDSETRWMAILAAYQAREAWARMDHPQPQVDACLRSQAQNDVAQVANLTLGLEVYYRDAQQRAAKPRPALAPAEEERRVVEQHERFQRAKRDAQDREPQPPMSSN